MVIMMVAIIKASGARGVLIETCRSMENRDDEDYDSQRYYITRTFE